MRYCLNWWSHFLHRLLTGRLFCRHSNLERKIHGPLILDHCKDCKTSWLSIDSVKFTPYYDEGLDE